MYGLLPSSKGFCYAFSALTLLAGHQEEQPACKRGIGMVICLEGGADCMHMVQLMPLHPKTRLASFISRLVLHFWYRLTQAVLEKKLFNECSVVLKASLVNRNFFTTSIYLPTFPLAIRFTFWFLVSTYLHPHYQVHNQH